MDRSKFMQDLEERLAGVPLEERMSALQYFNMYFDDAGPEREQEVIQELGTPKKVAADILAASDEGDAWHPPTKPEAAKNPLEPDVAQPNAPEAPSFAEAAQGAGAPYGYAGSYPGNPPAAATAYNNSAPPKGANPVKVLLIVLAVIIFSPVILSLAGALLALFISLVVLLMVPVIVGVVFVGTGIGVIIGGGVLASVSVGSGLLVLGMGLALLGLGLLSVWLGVWLLAKVIPATLRGASSLFQRLAR